MTNAGQQRRRRVIAGTLAAGTGLLGASLATEPGSRRFYGLTAGVAGAWIGGGIASGPLPRGARETAIPVFTGAAAFGLFYGGAKVARHIPVLNRAISSIFRYSDQGSERLVLLTALVNGMAEEVFFRGGVYAAVGAHPLARTTAVYALSTCATRNPALVLASGLMGTLFAWQRQRSGGIQAPILTHITWSTLMLRYLPPLFREPSDARR